MAANSDTVGWINERNRMEGIEVSQPWRGRGGTNSLQMAADKQQKSPRKLRNASSNIN